MFLNGRIVEIALVESLVFGSLFYCFEPRIYAVAKYTVFAMQNPRLELSETYACGNVDIRVERCHFSGYMFVHYRLFDFAGSNSQEQLFGTVFFVGVHINCISNFVA